MNHTVLLNEYSALERKIYNTILSILVMQSENVIEFTEDEKFVIDGTDGSEYTVAGIEFIRSVNGSNIINVIGNFYGNINVSLTDDRFSSPDKLAILKILERRFS